MEISKILSGEEIKAKLTAGIPKETRILLTNPKTDEDHRLKEKIEANVKERLLDTQVDMLHKAILKGELKDYDEVIEGVMDLFVERRKTSRIHTLANFLWEDTGNLTALMEKCEQAGLDWDKILGIPDDMKTVELEGEE